MKPTESFQDVCSDMQFFFYSATFVAIKILSGWLIEGVLHSQANYNFDKRLNNEVINCLWHLKAKELLLQELYVLLALWKIFALDSRGAVCHT